MKRLRIDGNGRGRQLLGALLAVFLVCTFGTPALAASVEVVAAPLTTQQSTTNGMVRVYLSSLGSPTSLTITVDGSYSINGKSNQALTKGEVLNLTFQATTGNITLKRGSTTLNMGQEFALRRHSTTGDNGLLIAESYNASNPYPGDMRFLARASGNGYKLYVIANVFIEDYLYGVVPYEMGNSAHIEALKSQAVAARTYTLRAMKDRAASLYDVVDTTNDQVYRGTPTGNSNCKAAVDATRGIVLMSGTTVISTYYTASNGGQTESSKNAWGGSGVSYLVVKDDPFDYNNSASIVRSATVYGTGSDSRQHSGLMSLLLSKASAALKSAGYQSTASLISIDKITGVTPHTPKYTSPSRLYTKVDFALTMNTKTTAGASVQVPLTVTCDIFTELESLLGMSINAGQNELWTVTKTGSDFKLEARRYGHGIGMSQRGAMQMGKEGYTYDQILGFYFSGAKRVKHNFTNTILSPVVSGSDSTEQVTVEIPADFDDNGAPAAAVVTLPTKQGTLGIYSKAQDGAALIGGAPHGVPVGVWAVNGGWAFIEYSGVYGYAKASGLSIVGDAPATTEKEPTAIKEYATVTGSGALNLRAEGKAGATILGTAPSGAILSVYSKTAQWAHIQYGAITAYASTDFLAFSSNYPKEVANPDATGATINLSDALETVNFRKTPSTTGTVISKLPHGTAVTLVYDDGSWCNVMYQGVSGYVMSTYIKTTGDAGDPGNVVKPPLGEGEVEAIVNSNASTLNLRQEASTNSAVLLEIPKGESLVVTSRGDTWCAVRYEGVSGYVMTQYLRFLGDGESGGEQPSGERARVTTVSGSLNLRAKAQAGSAILCTIPQNTVISILEKGSAWSKVTYSGYTGYVMSSFLTFLSGGEEQPAEVEGYAKVTTVSGSLNLRRQPLSGVAVLTTIPQNGRVGVIRRLGDWTEVEYGGYTGFVMTKFLTFEEQGPTTSPTATPTSTPGATGEPSPEPTPTAAPQDTTALVTTKSGSLNLRDAPSGKVIARIPRSVLVTVLEKGAQWCRVSYDKQTGYVMTEFLTFSEGETPPAGAGDAYVNTKSGSLNLRAEPKPGATILLRIPQYAYVTLLEKGTTWCRVGYGDQKGYVMTEYLKFTQTGGATPSPDGTATPAPTPGATATAPPSDEVTAWVNTKTGSLNLRAQPKADAHVDRTIPQYATVAVLEKGSQWCRVSYEGSTGYVMTTFLAFTGTPPVISGEDQEAWVLTKSGSLNLRESAKSGAKVLATIPRLEKLTVHNRGADWCHVTYDGQKGYVMTEFLTFANPNPASSPTAAPSATPASEATATPTPSPDSGPAQAETTATPSPSPSPTPPPTDAPAAESGPAIDSTLVLVENTIAVVNSDASTLNLRDQCDTEKGIVILEILKGEKVDVMMKGDTWCWVRYGQEEGFCMTKYLKFE